MTLDLAQPATCVVVEAVQPAVVVSVDAADITVACVQQAVDVQAPCSVVEVISGGPMGPPGETEGATFLAIAGETIFGHRAVRVANGIGYHPDLAAAAHAGEVCGVAVQSSSAGASFLVRTSGPIVEPSWAWGPGFVWCGDNGVLTQTPISTGWLLVVGRAIAPTILFVDTDTPVMRI